MRTKLFALLGAGVIVAMALTISACGSDNSTTSASSGGSDVSGALAEFAPPTAAPDNAQQGGDLTVLAAGDVDYIDPGAAYYQFTYMVTSPTQRALLSWQPDDALKPTPDLAAEEPTISDDYQSITFKIRPGVKFAPPVNRDVTSQDVKYAIERALLPGVANGFVAAYLGDMVGFEAAAKEATQNPTGGAPDIKGLTTPDDQTLQIELDRPTAAVVVQALSLPVGAPVPEEYAKEFDAENPSTYATHVVASGPYMIENDASGELTGYTSGKEIKLVRNPNWDPATDWRPAYLDSVDIQEGFSDTASASRKILQGSGTVNGDFPPPPEVLKQAATESDPGQLTVTPSGGNRYIALNTQQSPFDDINVRKAVIAGSDRTALRNTRGGELVGPVATHYLMPDFPGFEEAGGFTSDLDFLAKPEGDPALAAEYMKAAGFSSGKCEGDCKVTMVSDNVPPGKDTAEVFKGQLEDLGFEVSLQPVNHDIMYTRFCNVPDQEPDVCPNVGWIKDFNDPQSILDVPFNGDNIVSSNNSNWPLLDDPKINKAMDKAKLINDLDARNQAWGEIDKMINAQAPAVPWVWDNQPNIQSTDVAGVVNLFNANWDLSFTSLEG